MAVKKKQLKEVRLLRQPGDPEPSAGPPRQTLIGAGIAGVKSIGASISHMPSSRAIKASSTETVSEEHSGDASS